MQNNQEQTQSDSNLQMFMAVLRGDLAFVQEAPNGPFIDFKDLSATMSELGCNWDYAFALESRLLESRLMQKKFGKPAFSKEQLLDAIKKMGVNNLEIAARTLLTMQYARIGHDEINLAKVLQTMKDIDYSPEAAVIVMYKLKVWGHTPNRPLSDIKILKEMFPNRNLSNALKMFKIIEDHQAGRISEETWYGMAANVARDISELEALVMEKSGDVTMSSMLASQANLEIGKNAIESLIAELDKIGETQRKEALRASTESVTSDMSKMAISPKKKPASKTQKKKDNDEGGLFSKSRAGFLLGKEKKAGKKKGGKKGPNH